MSVGGTGGAGRCLLFQRLDARDFHKQRGTGQESRGWHAPASAGVMDEIFTPRPGPLARRAVQTPGGMWLLVRAARTLRG